MQRTFKQGDFMIEPVFKDNFHSLEKKNGKPFIYFDTAATSLKPKTVIEALDQFYSFKISNVHRGQHFLSEEATNLFEKTRLKIKNFIKAKDICEIVFTYGTTDAINSVARGLESYFCDGDEIIVSELEHHSNFIPWQMLAKRKSLILKIIPVDKDGNLIFSEYEKLLTSRTKLLALNYVSNSLGIINPVEKYIKEAKLKGALVLLDVAQAAPHFPLDVQRLDCDFLAFSSHKLFGPFGVGILYGKKESLSKLTPLRYGGGSIDRVSLEDTVLLDLPFKLESGTPPVAEVLGLGTAIDYIKSLGWDSIENYEKKLLEKAFQNLSEIKDLEFIGNVFQKRVPILSFNVKGVHHSDIAQILSEQGIALRSGHHCTQPLFKKLNLTGSVRVSFSVYNTFDEIDQLKIALEKAVEVLK